MEEFKEKTFCSKQELEDFFKKYELEAKKKLGKHNTRLLHKENQEHLHYHSLTYKCNRFDIFKPRGQKKVGTSNKCGCTFQVKICLTEDKKKLMIDVKNSCLAHNEECDKRSMEENTDVKLCTTKNAKTSKHKKSTLDVNMEIKSTGSSDLESIEHKNIFIEATGDELKPEKVNVDLLMPKANVKAEETKDCNNDEFLSDSLKQLFCDKPTDYELDQRIIEDKLIMNEFSRDMFSDDSISVIEATPIIKKRTKKMFIKAEDQKLSPDLQPIENDKTNAQILVSNDSLELQSVLFSACDTSYDTMLTEEKEPILQETRNGDMILTKEKESIQQEKTNDNTTLTKEDPILKETTNDDLDAICMEATQKKQKGRPAGTVKTKLCGAPIQERVFSKLSKISQAKILLQFLVPKESIENIIMGSYTIKKEELQHINKGNLKDTFADDEVDLTVLKRYMTNNCYQFLREIRESKVQDNKFTCDVCNLEASEEPGTIRCDQCLLWYHYKCVGVNPKTFDCNTPYFCFINCKN